jgi:hypothetical protein
MASPVDVFRGGSRVFHPFRVEPLLQFSLAIGFGLVLSGTMNSQSETVTPTGAELIVLLRQMQANMRVNDVLARQYVCDDTVHTFAVNQKGKKIRDYSAKFESQVVDGQEFNRIVFEEQNGKATSAEKLRSHQKHIDVVNNLGSDFDFVFDLRDGNPRDSVYSALPICCLSTLFNNRILRHEQINGRDNLVIESVPKASSSAASPVEKTSLDWTETTWIDVNDRMPTRIEVELLNDKNFLVKGSKEKREFFKLESTPDRDGHPASAVWLLGRIEDQSALKFLWQRQFSTFEDISDNCRRFDVKMRLLPDSVRDATHPASGQPR